MCSFRLVYFSHSSGYSLTTRFRKQRIELLKRLPTFSKGMQTGARKTKSKKIIMIVSLTNLYGTPTELISNDVNVNETVTHCG